MRIVRRAAPRDVSGKAPLRAGVSGNANARHWWLGHIGVFKRSPLAAIASVETGLTADIGLQPLRGDGAEILRVCMDAGLE